MMVKLNFPTPEKYLQFSTLLTSGPEEKISLNTTKSEKYFWQTSSLKEDSSKNEEA
jgi:hypothetical protein